MLRQFLSSPHPSVLLPILIASPPIHIKDHGPFYWELLQNDELWFSFGISTHYSDMFLRSPRKKLEDCSNSHIVNLLLLLFFDREFKTTTTTTGKRYSDFNGFMHVSKYCLIKITTPHNKATQLYTNLYIIHVGSSTDNMRVVFSFSFSFHINSFRVFMFTAR